MSDADPEGPPRDRGTPRSPFDRLRVRGLAVQSILAVIVVLMATYGLGPWLKQPANASLAVILAYATMAAVFMVRARSAGVNWKRFFGRAPRWADLPLLAIVVPLGMLTAGSLTIVFVPLSYLTPELVQRTILEDSPLYHIASLEQLIWVLLAVAVVAPVVEEMVFRGIVLQRFAHKWGTSTAVVVSSALFAIAHVEWVGHFLIGVSLALLYLRTRSLWVSIVTHAVYNGMFALTLAWSYFRHEPESMQTLASFRQSLGPGVLTFVLGAFLLWLYLDLYWRERTLGAVIAGPVPYDVIEEEARNPA